MRQNENERHKQFPATKKERSIDMDKAQKVRETLTLLMIVFDKVHVCHYENL